MDKAKKILKALLFPHIAIVLILVPVAAAMLIYAFAAPNANEIVSYASYALSAYALTIVCARAPRMVKDIERFKAENKYALRYLSDPQLRVNISLNASLLLNLAYAAMQLGLGFYHGSLWFYAFALYYVLLCVMRWAILRESRKTEAGGDIFREWLHYRFVGMELLLMGLALAVIVTYMVLQNRGFAHHPITTIAMAAYTFSSFTLAIVSVVKYKKYESPLLSASKSISLVSATVSVLTLETAMLSAFGEGNDPAFHRIMVAATGLAVCLFIFAAAIYMTVRSTREINRIKRSKSNEQ